MFGMLEMFLMLEMWDTLGIWGHLRFSLFDLKRRKTTIVEMCVFLELLGIYESLDFVFCLGGFDIGEFREMLDMLDMLEMSGHFPRAAHTPPSGPD